MEHVLNLFCHLGRVLSITAEIKKYQVKQSKVTLELMPAEQPASPPTRQRAKRAKNSNMNSRPCPHGVPLLLLHMALNSHEAIRPPTTNRGLGKEACSETERQEEGIVLFNKEIKSLQFETERKVLRDGSSGRASSRDSIFEVNNFLSLSLSYLPTTWK